MARKRNDYRGAAVSNPVVNKRGINFYLAMMGQAPPSDLDRTDPEAVRSAIEQYFQTCAENNERPLVSGLAMTIGLSRQDMLQVVKGICKCKFSEECIGLIRQAYQALELVWEYNFVNGGINPVVGIFLSKNNFGYRDQTDVVLTPNNPLGEGMSNEQIAAEVLKRLPDDSSE